MADVLLKDASGQEDPYENIDTVTLKTTDGGTTTYVSEHLIQNQVQADWNQTDNTHPGYIWNKPEVFEAEDELPAVTTEHSGKFLGVNDKGVWDIVDAPTDGGGGGSTTVTVQADYAQNDKDADDYIKNRPFYESISTVFQGEFIDTYNESNGSWSGEMVIEDASSTDLTIGNTYTYIWDGQQYVSECVNYMGLPVIGNTDALSGGSNGQPIVLGRDATGGLLGFKGWMAMLLSPPTDPAASGKYSCEIIGETIKTLDAKFISSISWNKVTDKPFGDVAAGAVAVEETTVTIEDIYGMPAAKSFPVNESNFVVGATYNITVNGAAYTGECIYDADDFEAKIIQWSDGMLSPYIPILGTSAYLPNSATIGDSVIIEIVLAENAVAKIDSKYIPDMGSGLPDSTTSDSGKVLTVDSDGTATWQTPANELPTVSSTDVGKFLRVNTTGAWVAETVPKAEEARF